MNKVFVYDPTASDKLSSVRGVGRYLQILKENFPDWIFTNKLVNPLTRNSSTVFINPFFNFLQKPLTMKRIAQKQIAVIHDLIPLKYSSHFPAGVRGKFNIFLNNFALKNYDLIITDSESSKKDIIDILRLPKGKIKVIYPCLPRVFSIQYPVSSMKKKNTQDSILDTGYCLYIGDATWNKNLVNLARAIKIINVTCVFVGKVFEKLNGEFSNPWQKEFKQFVEETRDDRRFIFRGFIPDSELIKLYQQASLNALPSRDEGFGFSYLEAAKFSCPSVLSDIPVLKEISSGNALFIDPQNPHDIADKIGEIYFNKEVKSSLGNKAFERSKFFSPDKFKREFLKVVL
ncbi:glycosyltransferase family 4 protein [Candidatus Roizmanbacteria bacterium]|nr:glycosyltransferase family 4 protein [Candidatus Roizmanbacteria bacterium]